MCPDAERQDANEPAVLLREAGLRAGKRQVLQHLNLEIKRGTVAVLYGANGAGKSSLLKLLAGLQKQSCIDGEGWIFGATIRQRDAAARRQLGYMPQQGGLYEELSVLENLEFRAAMLGQGQARLRALASVQTHALDAISAQRVENLSGGWKQRVSFAVALLAQPALLLLDEPTAGVDLEAKAQIWARVQALAQQGVTLLVSSHDADEARRAGELIALQNGRIGYQGSPAQLCRSLNLRRLHVQFDAPLVKASPAWQSLQQHPGLLFCEPAESDQSWRIAVRSEMDVTAHLASIQGLKPVHIREQAPELEDGLRAVLRMNHGDRS